MSMNATQPSTTVRKRLLRQPKWLWLAAVPVALLLLCYGLWVGVAFRRGEHFYGGRPTSYWRAAVGGWA